MLTERSEAKSPKGGSPRRGTTDKELKQEIMDEWIENRIKESWIDGEIDSPIPCPILICDCSFETEGDLRTHLERHFDNEIEIRDITIKKLTETKEKEIKELESKLKVENTLKKVEREEREMWKKTAGRLDVVCQEYHDKELSHQADTIRASTEILGMKKEIKELKQEIKENDKMFPLTEKCGVCGKKTSDKYVCWYSEEEIYLCRSHYLEWMKIHRSIKKKHKGVGIKKLCKIWERELLKWLKIQRGPEKKC